MWETLQPPLVNLEAILRVDCLLFPRDFVITILATRSIFGGCPDIESIEYPRLSLRYHLCTDRILTLSLWATILVDSPAFSIPIARDLKEDP